MGFRVAQVLDMLQVCPDAKDVKRFHEAGGSHPVVKLDAMPFIMVLFVLIHER